MKRFFLALAFAGLLSPAYGAGTIPFSLSQQLDQFGKPLAGCKFYTIQAGTTSTLQNAYQDSALTVPLPNPQTCDAAGRLPQMFFADGTIKVRLTDKNLTTIVVADNIQVIGASSGSGGGGTVDPTTILQTGWIQPVYGTGVVSGFVRANGRTIGSATSGATERANSDCQALFVALWTADIGIGILPVSGGRGVSAAADWAANKTLGLPDFRSRALAGLGDMGNSDNTLFAGVSYTIGGPTILGSLLGAAKHAIAQGNLPAVNLTTNITDPNHHHTVTGLGTVAVNNGAGASQGNLLTTSGGTPATLTTTDSATGLTASTPLGGSGTTLETLSTYALVTIYLKL